MILTIFHLLLFLFNSFVVDLNLILKSMFLKVELVMGSFSAYMDRILKLRARIVQGYSKLIPLLVLHLVKCPALQSFVY